MLVSGMLLKKNEENIRWIPVFTSMTEKEKMTRPYGREEKDERMNS